MNFPQGLFRAIAVALILGLVIVLIPATTVAQSMDPVLNEFVFNHTGTDSHEYVEVFGAPSTDLSAYSILEIEGDGTGAGTVDGVYSVGSTDPSGFWDTGFLVGEFENGTVTILLVDGFSGANGDDLDTNNDGALDTTPWTSIADSVAIYDGGSTDWTYASVVLASGFDGMSFSPGGASRIPDGMDTDSTTDWVRNDFDGAGLPGFTGTPAVGEAINTPGSTNQLVSTGPTATPPPPTPTFTPVPPTNTPVGPTPTNTPIPPTPTFTPIAGPPSVLLSEIRIDQPGSDVDEYFELAGTPGTSLDGVAYVVIGDGSGGSGVVESITDLSGSSIPGSGFFVAAESSFTLGVPDLTATLGFENSDNVTHLLVWEFSGTLGDDLDTNDDGVLDVVPWTSLIDSVSLVETPGSGDLIYSGTTLGPDGSFVPGHAFTCSDGWRIGNFGGGDDTPGSPNACAPSVLINEIRIDQPGGDTDEYFELAGDGGASLTGLTYLVIGDGSGGSGVVESVTDLSGSSIPGSGFFVAAESSFTLGSADLTATLGFENSDNVTHLLVWEFSGSIGDDLDTDDDGVLDSLPWSYVVDSVGLVETPGSGDLVYSQTTVGPDGSFVPGHVYLCQEGWRIGAFDPDGGIDSPGLINPCEVCSDPYTAIYDIQGSGSSSPLVGDEVSTLGVVVGDFQSNGATDSGDLGGFHIQDTSGDGDPTTSDGVFVYAPGSMDVAPGELVRVRGTIAEYFNLTEITSVSLVLHCGTPGTLSSTPVSLPVSDVSDFEPYEGMLVTFPQELYISEFFNFDRFGEIVLTSERQFQPTAIEEPGSAAAASIAAANVLGRITLDDGRTTENPDPAIHPNGMEFTLSNRFRGGDIVENVTGVVDYAFGLYRIQPTQGADYTVANPRPTDNPDVGGYIQVAAFNVLNYFTTIDDGVHDICGPGMDQECRGADDMNELERQRAKIVAAISELDADVVGLIEIQNDEDQSVADLVAGLNDVLGVGTYEYVTTGYIGTDAIKQALIYKPASVSPVGGSAVLDSDEFVDPNNIGDPKNRPALAQTFMDNATGGQVTVVVNHLKSKGSECGFGDDDPEQGSCNVTRTLAAQVLLDWLATSPTGSDAGVLLIGDLNSYDKEDPIDVLRAGGYSDLLLDYQGELAYSYVFDGQLGYLDYAMASPDLAAYVTGAAPWHINTDEPDILDYDTSFKQPPQDALYEPNEFRSSDHDPVVAGVCTDFIAPTLEVSVSPDALWPANHKYVDVTVMLSAIDNFDTDPTVTLLSVQSNEPDNGRGDGNTVNDIVIVDDVSFRLRAERSGFGSGRVYTITYMVTDDCGNSAIASVEVTVPHNQ